ncbi:MAG: nucleotide exchange factor GrpE [Proteobacteria bacterium]|jgi:molecular chaperone GrpE|nr:nucleotide exchange factor GrpE [Pseudomonadota bacterium]
MTHPKYPHPAQPSNGIFDPPLSPEEREAAAAVEQGDLHAQLASTEAELTSLKAQLGELNDQTLRAQAEAQNARRRADEEIAKNRKFAVESFADSLLPVVDSLEAGLAIDQATAEQLREGTEATLRQLLSALERNKVLEVNPAAGSRFDPTNQQAISMVPSGQEANTVVSVLQKGYTIADRVLRPALVTVSGPK